VELSPALLGLIGTLLVAIGGLLGVLVNARLKRQETVYQRLERVEESEVECQEQLFQLRTDMQTMWFALELMLKEHPEAEGKLMEAVSKVRARQKEFLRGDRTEG
jgi:hypothetical protein